MSVKPEEFQLHVVVAGIIHPSVEWRVSSIVTAPADHNGMIEGWPSFSIVSLTSQPSIQCTRCGSLRSFSVDQLCLER